ncbi:MAG: hypothetical protein U1F10_13645 [Burkholderiales bacterium]
MSIPDEPVSTTSPSEAPPEVRVRAVGYAEVVDTDALRWPGWMPTRPRDPALDRRAHPADFLLPIARRWLAALPSPVRPRALARQFPRIANRLADAWQDDASLHLVFDDLLIDHRGHRQGFPPAVKADLHRLWRYWQRERMGARRVAATG